jgi:ribonuclease HI
MTTLTCYIDGSEIFLPKKNAVRQGWGIVARHLEGHTEEINGFIEHNKKQSHLVGFFELMAFYYAVNHADEKGIFPEDVSFFTDCSWVAYAGFHLVKENKSKNRRDVIQRLKQFQKMFCPNDKHAVMKLIRWLGLAQMHWVKGHKKIIDNRRADYLARMAVYEKNAQEFDKWILNGVEEWDTTTESKKLWYPAFAKTIE